MRRIMMLLAVAAMMAVLVAASAAPTFAVPEDFLGEGPSANAVDGLLKAESQSKTRASTHDIVITKLIDKASSTI